MSLWWSPFDFGSKIQEELGAYGLEFYSGYDFQGHSELFVIYDRPDRLLSCFNIFPLSIKEGYEKILECNKNTTYISLWRLLKSNGSKTNIQIDPVIGALIYFYIEKDNKLLDYYYDLELNSKLYDTDPDLNYKSKLTNDIETLDVFNSWIQIINSEQKSRSSNIELESENKLLRLHLHEMKSKQEAELSRSINYEVKYNEIFKQSREQEILLNKSISLLKHLLMYVNNRKLKNLLFNNRDLNSITSKLLLPNNYLDKKSTLRPSNISNKILTKIKQFLCTNFSGKFFGVR